MHKNSFETVSDQMLESLAERIEAADKESTLEVEHSSGVLTITLANGKQYVINRHRVTEQLWWSSPVSGAKYFSLNANNLWLDKEQKELTNLLFYELKLHAGIEVV